MMHVDTDRGRFCGDFGSFRLPSTMIRRFSVLSEAHRKRYNEALEGLISRQWQAGLIVQDTEYWLVGHEAKKRT